MACYFARNRYTEEMNFFDKQLEARNKCFVMLNPTMKKEDGIKRSDNGILMMATECFASVMCPPVKEEYLKRPLFVGWHRTGVEGCVFRDWEDETPISRIDPRLLPSVY